MNKDPDDYGDIDLRKIFSFLNINKFFIISTAILFFSSSIIYSSFIHNTYKSESSIMPVTDNNNSLNSLGSLVGNFGGLTNLAGINLTNSTQSRTNEIIGIMKSYDFFEKLMNEKDSTIELMASYGWNRDKDEILIDDNIFDENNNQWLTKNYKGENEKPSRQKVFEAFKGVFKVEYDLETTFIKLSVEHYSPRFAKELLERIILLTDRIFVDKVIYEGEQSIAYLTERYEETNLAEIRSTLSDLIQIQTQKVALANSSSESIFKIINSPIIPEEKSGPSRLIISILGLLIGLLFGIFISYFRVFLKEINK